MPHPTRQRHRGAGTLEFALTALPLLGMGMLVAETAHWYQTRLLLRHALHESARAGSTAAASPEAIRTAFFSNLPTSLRQNMAAWTHSQLQIHSPSASSHADFAQLDPILSRTHVIRHDYQQEQHHSRLAQGWPDGRGPRSGQTIFEANTLHLILDHPHRPWLPGLPAVPIRIEARVSMQSHAHHWPTQAIIWPSGRTTPIPPPAAPAQWPEANILPTIPMIGENNPVADAEMAVQANSTTPIGMDESLCGIALCCS